MSAPSPALVVTDPPPLNSTSFPLGVDEFPASNLAVFEGAIPLGARAGTAPRPVDEQYED